MKSLLLLTWCLGASSAPELDAAKRALEDLRPRQALKELKAARTSRKFSLAQNVRFYAQLGQAYAYLKKQDEAVRAFEAMLDLDPSSGLPYTLSPKVTFLFEKARRNVRKRSAARIDVRWPRDQSVEAPVPIDVEVVNDPQSVFKRAKLHYRARGAKRFQRVPLRLQEEGKKTQLELPALGGTQSTELELYLSATDARGHEVYQLGTPLEPRSVALTYVAPARWYEKWWVWGLAAGVASAAVGVGVYLATDEPPANQSVTIGVR